MFKFMKKTVLGILKQEIDIELLFEYDKLDGMLDTNVTVAKPVCKKSMLFSGLTKTAGFTIGDLQLIQQLGYKVRVVKHVEHDMHFMKIHF